MINAKASSLHSNKESRTSLFSSDGRRLGVCCAKILRSQHSCHRSTARLLGAQLILFAAARDGRAVATPILRLLARTQLLVVTLHQVAELSWNRIAIHWGKIFTRILLREFFNHTVAQFDERLRDARVQAGDLWGFVAAFEVDAQLACAIKHLGGFVAEFGLIEQLFHIAQTVAPLLVAVAGEDAAVFLLLGVVEEQRLRHGTAVDGSTEPVIVAITIRGWTTSDLVVVVVRSTIGAGTWLAITRLIGISRLWLTLTPALPWLLAFALSFTRLFAFAGLFTLGSVGIRLLGHALTFFTGLLAAFAGFLPFLPVGLFSRGLSLAFAIGAGLLPLFALLAGFFAFSRFLTFTGLLACLGHLGILRWLFAGRSAFFGIALAFGFWIALLAFAGLVVVGGLFFGTLALLGIVGWLFAFTLFCLIGFFR